MVATCVKCGNYAIERFENLLKVCPGGPQQGQQRRVLKRIREGKHPGGGQPITLPWPKGPEEEGWDPKREGRVEIHGSTQDPGREQGAGSQELTELHGGGAICGGAQQEQGGGNAPEAAQQSGPTGQPPEEAQQDPPSEWEDMDLEAQTAWFGEAEVDHTSFVVGDLQQANQGAPGPIALEISTSNEVGTGKAERTSRTPCCSPGGTGKAEGSGEQRRGQGKDSQDPHREGQELAAEVGTGEAERTSAECFFSGGTGKAEGSEETKAGPAEERPGKNKVGKAAARGTANGPQTQEHSGSEGAQGQEAVEMPPTKRSRIWGRKAQDECWEGYRGGAVRQHLQVAISGKGAEPPRKRLRGKQKAEAYGPHEMHVR